jgi:hypothetical protein
VERGIINPTVSRLWKIADALKTLLSQIAKRMEVWIVNQERRHTNQVEGRLSLKNSILATNQRELRRNGN